MSFLIVSLILVKAFEYTHLYLARHSNQNQTGKINLIMAHKVDADLMIFGSSVSEVGITSNLLAEALNVEVYNASIDGTSAVKSGYLVDEYIGYTNRCKVALFGLSAFALSSNDQVTQPSRFLAHYNRNEHVRNTMRTEAKELYADMRIPFYSYAVATSDYYKNVAFGLKNVMRGVELAPDNENGSILHDAEYVNTDDGRDARLEPQWNIAEKYQNLFKTVKAGNVLPVAVIMPLHRNGQKAYRDYSEYVNMVRRMCSESDVSVLDFSNHELCDQSEYFYNNGHLNIQGAEIITKIIADSLTFNQVLKVGQ